MSKKQCFPMTIEGKEKLNEELNYLTVEKRQDVINRIKKARTFCDFSEDSEFDEALKEQFKLEERIDVVKDMIHHADIIEDNHNEHTVSLGSSVTIIEQPEGDEETYRIVGIAEADPISGKISNQSPLAQSLLGKKMDDQVYVTVPDGKIVVKIVNIK